MVNYPAKIDTSISLPKAVDNLTPVTSSQYNQSRDAVIAVETELGIKPSSTYGTVRARLDYLESAISSGGGGTSIHNNLTGLQGGTTDEYYHLTSASYTWLTDGYSDGYWAVTKGGTGQTSYTTGDILYADNTDSLSILSATTDGYVLSLSSGIPAWAPPSASGITDHNLLDNLQGGSVDGYYHLSPYEYTWLTDGYNDGYWGINKGGTGITSYSQGDILYADSGGILNILSIGINGQLLTVNSSLPTWDYPSSLYSGSTPIATAQTSPSPFTDNSLVVDGYLFIQADYALPIIGMAPTSTHNGTTLIIGGQNDFTGTYNGGNIAIISGDGYAAGNIGLQAGETNQGNIIINGNVDTTDMQSAQGSIFIKNGNTVPVGNPTDGGYLFVEGGALKWRGSGGTVTSIAPA